ncbi:hypothetical protein LGL55_08240 [Clostridium tagluense]|uniref:hypothetical protein n=1 Tax=Clostridium tagluense TaxID=360422 RepID=UPI001C0BD019|nr:hypothetical protein [Clostridium tagluense]MBU3127286.1 hypothetical protein [Clostridium tagluense]MCB2311240.1 hypothetical protein [Clostridium tagluense]MCB2315964.1 hypothetical protein [Clostridium tagluense]MCB2320689.1 hypothetical protein [Clostridium tagluense]MCB2325706.1 hypothetical protein [Clostridium tagluense]
MKKNNTNRYLNTKAHVKSKPKSIIKSIGSKLAMLLCVIIPVAALIGYAMDMNFFSITIILSAFVLIISIAAYLKDEVIYPNPKAIQHDNTLTTKKNGISQKHSRKFSVLIKKGTIQVVLCMIIIILCTYLGQVIYKAN